MSIREDEIPVVLEILKETLLQKLGTEVDLIFQYGSHLRGNAHKFSDVDLSFVPVHETTWENVTVLVGETLVDLYPMHWPHLERMANFDDRSSMVLLENRILYQRNAAAAERFRALSAQLFILLQPEARPDMIRKAQKTFQETAYPYYLLRLQAAAGHTLGCCQQAQSILQTVLHSLAVCNQACIDTRKMAQVMALPKLPADFARTVERISASFDPNDTSGEYVLTQYAVAPLILVRGTDQEWNILNFDRETYQEWIKTNANDFELVEFGGGMYLVRKVNK